MDCLISTSSWKDPKHSIILKNVTTLWHCAILWNQSTNHACVNFWRLCGGSKKMANQRIHCEPCESANCESILNLKLSLIFWSCPHRGWSWTWSFPRSVMSVTELILNAFSDWSFVLVDIHHEIIEWCIILNPPLCAASTCGVACTLFFLPGAQLRHCDDSCLGSQLLQWLAKDSHSKHVTLRSPKFDTEWCSCLMAQEKINAKLSSQQQANECHAQLFFLPGAQLRHCDDSCLGSQLLQWLAKDSHSKHVTLRSPKFDTEWCSCLMAQEKINAKLSSQQQANESMFEDHVWSRECYNGDTSSVSAAVLCAMGWLWLHMLPGTPKYWLDGAWLR